MDGETQIQGPAGVDEGARPGADAVPAPSSIEALSSATADARTRASAAEDSPLDGVGPPTSQPPRSTTPRRPGAEPPAPIEPLAPWELICGECGGPAFVYLPSPAEANRRDACYVWGLGGHLCKERERWPVGWCDECAGMHVEGDHDDGFCMAAPLPAPPVHLENCQSLELGPQLGPSTKPCNCAPYIVSASRCWWNSDKR